MESRLSGSTSRRGRLLALLLKGALGLCISLAQCAAPFAFFDESEGAAERVPLALLALFTLSASGFSGSTTSATGPEYIAATSLRASGGNGEVYLFRKSDSDCTLSQRDVLTVGGDPYDIQRTNDSATVYVANSTDGTISVVRPDFTAETLSLTQTATVAGPGGNSVPFGMTFHNSGRLYTADGDGASGSVAQMSVDSASGQLSDISPNGYIAAGTRMWFAVLDSTQNFVYATHYDGAQIYRYSVDSTTGALTELGTTAAGTQPWHINIHPSQNFLYATNYGSASVSMYTYDTGTGALSAIGGGTIAAAANPIGLAVGTNYAYAAGNTGNALNMYAINQSTGELTSLGSESTGAFQPYGVGLDRSESCLYVGQTDGDADAADGFDRIAVYSISSAGTLSFVGSYSAGIGPRFFTSLQFQ